MARWATPEQVAEYLSCSPSKIRKDIMAGKGVGKLFKRIDSLRRADLDEVDAFIAGGKS